MDSSELDQMVRQKKEELTRRLDYSLFENNYIKALQNVQGLIEIDAQDNKLHSKKACILFSLNQFQQALQAGEIALSKGQQSIDFYNMLIKCHLEMDNLQLAQKTTQQLINKNQPLKTFFGLIETVKKIESQDHYRIPQKDEKVLEQMKDWLYPKGAEYDKVKIATQHKGYRGAIALKSIKKSQTIVFIPKSQLLTLQMARQNPISKQLDIHSVELLSPKHSLMAILLLQERQQRQKSKFKPYLDILPKDLSCFPINYTTDQLTELIGSPFLYQIREKVLDLKKDYDAICYVSGSFAKKYTFKDYCWARLMVGSRVFGVIVDGVKTQILAPFADMLNHKVPKQTIWNYSQQRQGFFIQSLKQIQIGEQLFDSYGKKCNSRFLLSYGFVLQNNDRNQICIKIDFQEKDALVEKKMQMLRLSNPSQLTKIFRITKFIQENNFFEMMGYLRFKKIQNADTLNLLEKISNIKKTAEPYKPSRTPPTTMQVQMKIWAQLKNICQNYLNDYSTTLQQDQQLLSKDNQLSQNMRNIISLRLGQKRLYHYYCQMSSDALQILSKGYIQACLCAQKQLQKTHYKYIQKILNLMPHLQNPFLKKDLKQQTTQLQLQQQNLPTNQLIQQDDEISRQY